MHTHGPGKGGRAAEARAPVERSCEAFSACHERQATVHLGSLRHLAHTTTPGVALLNLVHTQPSKPLFRTAYVKLREVLVVHILDKTLRFGESLRARVGSAL